jgi:hypothetical protein
VEVARLADPLGRASTQSPRSTPVPSRRGSVTRTRAASSPGELASSSSQNDESPVEAIGFGSKTRPVPSACCRRSRVSRIVPSLASTNTSQLPAGSSRVNATR